MLIITQSKFKEYCVILQRATVYGHTLHILGLCKYTCKT